MKRTTTIGVVIGLIILTAVGYGAMYAPMTQAEPEPTLGQIQIAGAIGAIAVQLHALQTEIQQQRADETMRSSDMSEAMRQVADTLERLSKELAADREERAKRWPR